MKVTISLMAALSFIGGIVAFFMARSAVHEILAAILILCFVVSIVGLAVLERLDAIIPRQSGPLFPTHPPKSGCVLRRRPAARGLKQRRTWHGIKRWQASRSRPASADPRSHRKASAAVPRHPPAEARD